MSYDDSDWYYRPLCGSWGRGGTILQRKPLFLLALLVISAVVNVSSPTGRAISPPVAQKFGFGDSGLTPNNWLARGYTCQTFYKGIFMTPPYPSVYVWQLGDIKQWSQTGGPTQKFLDCVGGMLNSNQYMILLFGLNTGIGCCTYDRQALTWFKTYAQHLSTESTRSGLSFTGRFLLGLDGEHSQGMSQSDFNAMVSYLQGLGFKNANRYLGGNHNPYLKPVNTLQTSNWPFANDYRTVATPTGGGYIGSFVGVIDGAPYPFIGCGPAYGASLQYAGVPGWTDSPVSQGFRGTTGNSQPCAQNWPYQGAPIGTIQDVLAVNAGNPDAQFVVFVNNWACPSWPPQIKGGTVCFSPTFRGASGLQTIFQVDNPQFRNTIWQWVQAHPGVYLLGNGG